MSLGFRLPNASSGFKFSVYCFPISFPSMLASKPIGSILCPTDRMNGLTSVFGVRDSVFGMFVSKTSSVFDIFPVNSISTKSFLFIIKFLSEEGF